MTMYEELIKQLRNRRICVQYGGDLGQDYPLMREAADAIEELIAWHNADVRELGRQKILIAGMRPVVRGKWDEYEDFDEYGGGKFVKWACSECCYIVKRGWAVRDKNICEKPTERFCPNCGARMEGDG